MWTERPLEFRREFDAADQVETGMLSAMRPQRYRDPAKVSWSVIAKSLKRSATHGLAYQLLR